MTIRARSSWFLRPLTFLVVLSLIAFHAGSPAKAANGSNLRSIIADSSGTACVSVNPQGNHNGVAVGIAFDGTSLLISCYNDNTVTSISPADGSQVPPPSGPSHPAVHTIAGASALGALAFQGPAGPLWACSSSNIVGTIDWPAMTTFTPVFDTATVTFPDGQTGGSGCFDGLAFDGQDASIWASGDVSPETDHYTIAGTGIAHFANSALLGGIGNSGIAVGGQKLYLANDGASQIYELPKDFSTSTLFSTFPARLEDLECDDLTFAVSNMKGAIWSKDAYDNILNAWEIPLGQCVFGGGPAITPFVSTEIHDASENVVTSVPAGTTVHDSATVRPPQPGRPQPAQPVIEPTGTVTFSFFNTIDCTGTATDAGTIPLDSGGTAHPSAPEGPLAPGSYSFQAHYNGDAIYKPADSACEPLDVTQATPRVSTDIHDANHNVVTTVPAGSTVHDSATVTGTFGTPTGSVDFTFYTNGSCTDPGTPAGTVMLNMSGTADPSSPEGPLAPGTYSFKAHYGGNATYSPADSPCEPLTVSPATATVRTDIHDASHNVVTTVPAGSTVHDSAAVTGSFGTPTGTVTFSFFNTIDCTGMASGAGTVMLNGSGVADPSDPEGPLAAGSYSFSARYNGSAAYRPADSPCEPLRVTAVQVTPTVRTEIHDEWHHVVTSVPAGSKVHDKATVTGSSGTPTGTVTFTFYTNNTCTGTGIAAGVIGLDSYGVAHPSNTQGPLAAGSYSFKARYNGDAKYTAADSPCEPLEVTKPQPTVRTEIHDAWHHAVTSVPEGSKVHDKATVTGSSGTPTGNVSFTFYTNKTCYGTGTAAGTIALDSYGVAHPSTTEGPLSAGNYAFKARYNGNGTYSPADSACEPLTVTPKPQQCRPEQKDHGKGKVKDEKGGDGGDFDFDECDDNHQDSHKDRDHNVDFQSSRHDPPKYESASASSGTSRMGLIDLPIGVKATTIGEGTNNGQPVTYVLVVTDLGLGLGNIYSLTLTDDTGVIYTRTGTLLSGEIVVLQ